MDWSSLHPTYLCGDQLIEGQASGVATHRMKIYPIFIWRTVCPRGFAPSYCIFKNFEVLKKYYYFVNFLNLFKFGHLGRSVIWDVGHLGLHLSQYHHYYYPRTVWAWTNMRWSGCRRSIKRPRKPKHIYCRQSQLNKNRQSVHKSALNSMIVEGTAEATVPRQILQMFLYQVLKRTIYSENC